MTFKEWLFKELTDIKFPEKEAPASLPAMPHIKPKDDPPKPVKTATAKYTVTTKRYCKK